MVTLLCFIAWIYIISFAMLLSPFSRVAATLAVLAWCTLLLPTGPVHWKGFLANPVFALWRRYFNFSVCYEQQLDPAQHYLYADFPHGAFPLSQMLGLTVRHLAGWDGERFYGLAADSAFRIPLWRHIYSWLGIVPASRENLKRYLKWGSVGITPGGIAEMYLAGGKRDHVYIRNRKGFVAAAVEEGVPIVPVYHFGNTQIFSFGPRFLEPYGRRWKFSLGLLYGLAALPIPRRVPLMMCVGAPVPVPKVARDHPDFAAAVDDTHRRYMEALQGLYDKWKPTYGWDSHTLVMH